MAVRRVVRDSEALPLDVARQVHLAHEEVQPCAARCMSGTSEQGEVAPSASTREASAACRASGDHHREAARGAALWPFRGGNAWRGRGRHQGDVFLGRVRWRQAPAPHCSQSVVVERRPRARARVRKDRRDGMAGAEGSAAASCGAVQL